MQIRVFFQYVAIVFTCIALNGWGIVNCQSDDVGDGIFESTNYWDVFDKPVMANGHIGFVPYGESIYMNGLYNGYKDQSHRARIPNYGNVQFEPCTQNHSSTAEKCIYALDIYNGVFRTSVDLNVDQFRVEHLQYAHRFYDTAMINHIKIKRLSGPSNDTLQVRLLHSSGAISSELTINSVTYERINNKLVTIVKASTNIVEDPQYQPNPAVVSILYEDIPDTIELKADQDEANFIWITVVQSDPSVIEYEYQKIQENRNNLLTSHTNEWAKFWTETQITAKGNKFLTNAIQASQFALASSLPSLSSFRLQSTFYGICPAGLGLDRDQEVYLGHSFWDTEIWMQPAILLFEPQWSQRLLNYRHKMRHTAHANAINTGYQGYRYPWESAYTGIDVTPNNPNVYTVYEQHITANIGHALRKHFLATHDLQWFKEIGCDLAYGTAEFWASRVTWNENTRRFDINGIMGPDEDHYNINNNAYTNVVAALNLHFGSYASCVCNQLDPSKYSMNTTWAGIAKRMTLLYDRQLDYNPEFDGYNLNMAIKQADTALLGYPLQFANMQPSTRRNNLHLYANLTRSNGPAMTWSMHAIGHLEMETLTEGMFNQTYVPYLRSPYFVWNEYVNGVSGGAGNFITGAGGFMQLIMYGFAGIRINSDSLSIRKPQVPPNTNELRFNGISYMNSKSEITVRNSNVVVKILHGREEVRLFIDGKEQIQTEKIFTFGLDQEFMMKARHQSQIESCALPEDTVEPLDVN